MRFRAGLGHSMGLVLVLALSFGLADFSLRHSDLTMPRASTFTRVWWNMVIYFNSVIVGIALLGGIVFLTEVIRRRPFAEMGIGRWTWSITSISCLLILSSKAVQLMCFLYADKRTAFSMDMLIGIMVRALADYFSGPILLSLIPVLATTRLMRLQPDSNPDFFEWAGKAYITILILWGIISQLIIMFVSNALLW